MRQQENKGQNQLPEKRSPVDQRDQNQDQNEEYLPDLKNSREECCL